MTMRHMFIATLASATVLATFANAETYICKMKTDRYDKGWISKTIAINIDRKTNAVLVSDGVILLFAKQPIKGRLYKSADGIVTVTIRGGHVY